MGHYREYNPKMVAEWHKVNFPRRDEDQRMETTPWGRQYPTWTGYIERRDVAVNWCDGSMIHGRFAYNGSNWNMDFFFKSKRDAMAFKLTFG